VRIAKGGDPVISRPEDGFAIGRAIVARRGRRALRRAGAMTARACSAPSCSAARHFRRRLHAHTIKPLDDDAIASRRRARRGWS
jgi:transketolase